MEYRVFVISKEGKPLMPTKRFGKVRRLLNSGQAKVVKREPFTIQLLYETFSFTQEVKLGIDAGYLNIGFSAVTDKEELIGGFVYMLSGMSERNEERRMYRRNRRNRLRYRKNKGIDLSLPSGWIAPSIQHKLDTHIRVVEQIKEILPVTQVIIEVAAFDVHKIKDPDVLGVGYQQGEMRLSSSHMFPLYKARA